MHKANKNNKTNKAKGGSGNAKMKKFPRILDYLEANHKNVYSLIDDLAMHSSLTPRRGGAVTFLMPDADYVTLIRKTIESDDPEKATDMVGSLILSDLFETPADFTNKQDDIPNALGRKVTITGVTNGKVNIDNGELTIDAKFKPFTRQGSSKRGNIAIWNLKGVVSYEKAARSNFKYAKIFDKNTGRTEGGHEYDNELCKLIETITK